MRNKLNLKAQQVVENLAAQLLNSTLSASAYDALVNDITLAFMTYKGWDSCKNEGVTFEEQEGYSEYSSLVLWEAVSYALKDYGKTDQKTGKVIPFCQLANHALKLKAADVVKEKLSDRDRLDQGTKKASVEAYLRRLCKEKGAFAAELKFNVLNKDAVTRYILEMGGSDKDVDTAMTLIENTYVSNDGFSCDDDGDDNTVQLTDIQAYNDSQSSELYFDGAISTFEAALKEAGKSKNARALKQLMTYHCFTQGAEDNLDVVLYLEDYIDPDFCEFLRSYNGPLKDDRAIAAFTGHKLDTVQKTLCSARSLLKEQAAAKRETIGVRQ